MRLCACVLARLWADNAKYQMTDEMISTYVEDYYTYSGRLTHGASSCLPPSFMDDVRKLYELSGSIPQDCVICFLCCWRFGGGPLSSLPRDVIKMMVAPLTPRARLNSLFLPARCGYWLQPTTIHRVMQANYVVCKIVG
jgi:hypothetical protein